ncbi:hypothetical protein ACPPVS_08270 [Cellulomonas sp. McL0617]|uniref:hypothetical protein n=1 Tax=Cellulomonas sp. McL0617 TaxID=3415675 RepID=UPI003CF8ABD4
MSHDAEPRVRPRWATYSVRAHTDLGALISDVLMHDAVVFPCPADDDDFTYWADAGWDPELLALRVTQLGDAAVTIPWDAELREKWRFAFDHLSPQERADPERAYLLTAELLADRPFVTLMDTDDDRFPRSPLDQPTLHPAFAAHDGRGRVARDDAELVAAYQGTDSVRFTGGSASTDLDALTFEWRSGQPGLRLQLPLACVDDPDEETLHRVLDLIGDDDFRRARRELWAWENQLSPTWTAADVATLLEQLVEEYNRAVVRELAHTRVRTTFLLVPVAIGLGIDQLFAGVVGTLVGAASGLMINQVKARFPVLTGPAVRASHHPGSAVSGMLSIVGQG